MSERGAYLKLHSIAAVLTTLPASLLLTASVISPEPGEYDDGVMSGLARTILGFFALPAAAFVLNLLTRRDSPRSLQLAADTAGWLAVLAGALALLAGAWLAWISAKYEQTGEAPILGWAFFIAYFGGIILCAIHGLRERPASRKVERETRRRPPLSLADPQNP
ncbi:MAG: hypothetical protein QM608_11605 [Caulobacter sp.]